MTRRAWRHGWPVDSLDGFQLDPSVLFFGFSGGFDELADVLLQHLGLVDFKDEIVAEADQLWSSSLLVSGLAALDALWRNRPQALNGQQTSESA